MATESNEMSPLAFRIQERCDALGISVRGAAKDAGLGFSTIRNILEGRSKSPRTDTIAKIAPVLKTTEAWLLKGEGDPAPNFKSKNPVETRLFNHTEALSVEQIELPILGVVEAGAWREAVQEDNPETILVARDMRFPSAKQFLLKVRGDSMNAAKPIPLLDGALIQCIDWWDAGLAIKSGLLIVVRRTNGYLCETTVKRLVVLPTHYELHPESTNPAHAIIKVKNDRDDEAGAVEIIGLVIRVIVQIPI
jgi:SOS-response transcriptional repressor LexA